MRKLSQITESIWADIHKRSNGVQVRKEDDINLLDIDGLFNYVENNYSDRVCKIDSEEIRGFQGWKNCVVFPFDDDLEITITRFLDTGKIRDIVIMWDKNGVQDSFIRKLNYRFNICLAPRENSYIDIKDKDGSVSNQTYINLLDFILENEKKDVLYESVWADIHKRSNGIKTRKEDDINHLDQDELFDYIQEHYICTSYSFSNHHQPVYDENVINIPFLIPETSSYAYNASLMFRKTGCVVTFNKDMKWECPEVYELINDNYEISDVPDNKFLFSIYPLNGSMEITNKFFIDVLDLLIDNIEVKDKQELILKRK